jgi:hypothetical protein
MRTPRKKYTRLSEEQMGRAVDMFVGGEKLSVVAALNDVSLAAVSFAAKRRGSPARVLVANCCPHCKRRLVE